MSKVDTANDSAAVLEERRGETAAQEGPRATAPAGARGRVARIRSRLRRLVDGARLRIMLAGSGEQGMSTVEYAIGTIAAAAFGAVLYQVVTGDSIVSALTGIIDDALNTSV